jgi:DNA-binding NarL/FixJ family response regulator
MKPGRSTTKRFATTDKRVLIVDDHPFLRLGLTEALGREPGFCVCGAAASAEEALAAIQRLEPDVVVADLKLPGKSGLELIKDLASLWPRLPVIVLSMYEEEVFAERCLRAGARGYVMKNEGVERLAAAIWRVLGGGVDVSSRASECIVEGLSRRRRREPETPLHQLTDRELEVLQWLGRGLSTRDLAHQLHISVKTVESHRLHLKSKLGLATAPELIAYAARSLAADG